MKLSILLGSFLLAALVGTSIGSPLENAPTVARRQAQTASKQIDVLSDARPVVTLSEVIVRPSSGEGLQSNPRSNRGPASPPVHSKTWTCSSEWKLSLVGGSYRECGWK